MISGVYGVGYAAAALDPLRHWTIVLVGFLGMVFVPVGFGLTLLTDDVIWWLPFALILLHVYWTNHQPKAANA